MSLYYLTSRLKQMREYAEKPLPSMYKLLDLLQVWLYTTCILENYKHADPILSHAQYDNLTIHLRLRWDDLPNHIKAAIPFDALNYDATTKINWNGGMGFMTNQDCRDYALIQQGKHRAVPT